MSTPSFRLTLALPISAVLTACSNGGIALSNDVSDVNNTMTNSEFIGKSVTAAREEAFSFNENFTDIAAASGALTQTMIDQLGVKSSNQATLAVASFGGGSPVYSSGTPRYISGNFNLSFALKNMLCSEYLLAVTYRRNSNAGTRTLTITHDGDDQPIQGELNLRSTGTMTTSVFTISRHNVTDETFTISGTQARLYQVGVTATCTLRDSDSDGLVDAREALIGTNPLQEDTDGDDFEDTIELSLGLDPLNIDDGLNWDCDNDGIPDRLDPQPKNAIDPTLDSDGDGISDKDELLRGTDPNVTDLRA